MPPLPAGKIPLTPLVREMRGNVALPVPPLPTGRIPLTPEVRGMSGKVALPVPPLPIGRIPATPDVSEMAGKSADAMVLKAGGPLDPTAPAKNVEAAVVATPVPPLTTLRMPKTSVARLTKAKPPQVGRAPGPLLTRTSPDVPASVNEINWSDPSVTTRRLGVKLSTFSVDAWVLPVSTESMIVAPTCSTTVL